MIGGSVTTAFAFSALAFCMSFIISTLAFAALAFCMLAGQIVPG
jgi:uncharacterized membrane protein (DUF485 family)